MATVTDIETQLRKQMAAYQQSGTPQSAATVAALQEYLDTGVIPPRDSAALAEVNNALKGTPYQYRPDQFYSQLVASRPPKPNAMTGDNTDPYAPAASAASQPAANVGGGGFFGGGGLPAGGTPGSVTEYVNRILQGARNGDAHAGNAAAGMANPNTGAVGGQLPKLPGAAPAATMGGAQAYGANAMAGEMKNGMGAGAGMPATGQEHGVNSQVASSAPPNAATQVASATNAAPNQGATAVPTVTPANQTPVTGGGATGGNPNMNPAYAGVVEGDQNQELMAVLQSMGYDPTRPGIVGQAIAKMLQPALAANSAFGSYANGGNGITGADPMSTLTNAENIGKQFLTNGANPWQYVQGLAHGASSNPAFQSMLSGISSEADQQKMLALLGQSRNYGASGLAQQYSSDMNTRNALGYTMAQQAALKAGTPAPNNYMKWVLSQPPEIQAALLGPQK